MSSDRDYDRFLIDWADEFVQNLVAAFSARRPTPAIRLAVVGLYGFVILHLLFVVLLPFERDAIAHIIGRDSTGSPQAALDALATGIIVGGISFHLLCMAACVALSFLVRARKTWTLGLATAVMGANFAVSLNALGTPTISRVLVVLNIISLFIAGGVTLLLWASIVWPASATVDVEPDESPSRAQHPRLESPWLAYVWAFVTVAVCVLILLLAASRINSGAAASVLLLSVLIVARLWGTGPAVLASSAAAASFSYFFLPPLGFGIDDPNDWVAFAAFTTTALIAGGLWTTAERRRHEIERLFRELQVSFDRAAELEASRRSEQLKAALLDALSHNLRTPLTAIKVAVTALQVNQSARKEDERELVDVINEETDRLNRFVGGLTTVDERQPPTGAVTAASVDTIVRAAIARAAAITRGYHLVVDVPSGLPSVAVEPAPIVEALYILLDNATRYSAVGTTIQVSALVHDEASVWIDVTDHGPGIPPELRERVFERFFRVSPASGQREGTPGTGLGLSIARRLLEAQGGRIWIEGAPAGRGTRAVLSVPIALGAKPEQAAEAVGEKRSA